MVRRRMFPNGAGTAHAGAGPRRLPATSPAAISRLGCRTGSGPRTSPGIRAGDGKACLSPPVDCHDGRIAAYTAGPGPDAGLADGMPAKAAESLPEGAHPLARSGRGRHCRRPGRPDLMGRYGPARPTGAKGPSPDDAAAEGFFGRMRTESVHPGHREERTRDETLAPGRRLHPPTRPQAHQTVARLDESGTIPSKPRNGYVITSKKNVHSPPTRRRSRLTVRTER